MSVRDPKKGVDSTPPRFSNGAIAAELMTLAQLLGARGANPFKVKAYRRAAKTIKALSESVDDLVRRGADLTVYPAIGPAIAGVIEEIVKTGKLRRTETLRTELKPEILELAQYPHLDPRRVKRIYKKFNISSIDGLKEKLESGEVAAKLGVRMAQHIRQGLSPSQEMLLYEADRIVPPIQMFLIERCGVRRAKPAGDYRRRVEIIREISFLIETDDFRSVLKGLQTYGGGAELLEENDTTAHLRLSTGITLRITLADRKNWGTSLVLATGSGQHLRQLPETVKEASTEAGVYRQFGLAFIPPELREGHDEIALAAGGQPLELVSESDIIGELHAHTTASDGANTIEEMAEAAKERGYDYVGISDHSQSLKIAHGLSEEELWEQIRFIDRLNERLAGIRVLKSAEVDILAGGLLDYSKDLLKALDYTICSIHSRFGFGKTEQTERILRAMDNRYFSILGHATGRLLLKRPGYEIDIERIVEHASATGCSFEINSSPDRLDLSADHARLARQAGIKIAITTEAHSIHEFRYLQYGVDQARRAGLPKSMILNHLPWLQLGKTFKERS